MGLRPRRDLKNSAPSNAMSLSLRLCTGIFAFALIACVNKNSREKGNLKSITVRSTIDSTLEPVLLKSFGIETQVKTGKLFFASAGVGDESGSPGYNVGTLSVGMSATPESVFRKILPLYGQLAQSRVKFQAAPVSYLLSDLLSPSLQAASQRRLRLNDSGINLTSVDALFSLMLSDDNQLRIVCNDSANMSNLLLDGQSFKTIGEIPGFSQPVTASRRERNSGFSVGDLLVFTEKSSSTEVKHVALWLDHDVYFEALPLSGTVVFRIASYAQILEDLAPRVPFDVRQLRMTIVRKHVSWNDIGSRLKAFKQQKNPASAQLIYDAAGRAVASALQGMTLALVPDSSESETR
ncbi:MAG: hypothetical protein RI953_916 [Pseudomonadota bacterium]|jgi:hypothetical protein